MTEMTCREFDEVVHGFVHMELLDVNVREAALEHASHCELCSGRMRDAAALAEATETMGQRARAQQTPPHVEAALMAAFRNHSRRASWRRSLEWASVGAAAAVLLIFLWTANWRSKGQTSPAPNKDVSSQSAIAPGSQSSFSAEAGQFGSEYGYNGRGRHREGSLCGLRFRPGAIHGCHCRGRSGNGCTRPVDQGFARAAGLSGRGNSG